MYLFSQCYVLFEKKLAVDYHWQEDVFIIYKSQWYTEW